MNGEIEQTNRKKGRLSVSKKQGPSPMEGPLKPNATVATTTKAANQLRIEETLHESMGYMNEKGSTFLVHEVLPEETNEGLDVLTEMVHLRGQSGRKAEKASLQSRPTSEFKIDSPFSSASLSTMHASTAC